jgi:hypothetical protein
LSAIPQVFPGLETPWQVRNRFDAAAVVLAKRHYSRRKDGGDQLGGPGRVLVLVSPCERALWVTRCNTDRGNADGLDCYRCMYFRNEGAGLSSTLIRDAMELTERLWGPPPPDGWVTWVDASKVASANPGYCFKLAGWQLDSSWKRGRMIRLRAPSLTERMAA